MHHCAVANTLCMMCKQRTLVRMHRFRHPQVVCRQLGKRGGTGHAQAYYGPGKQGMMVARIRCPTGKELSLNACTADLNWGFDHPLAIGWNHDEDWGVECTDPTGAVGL